MELLVVIIIVALLAAIALPSFLNQANKARESEARTYVAAINRAQQTFYMENNRFGNLSELALGINPTTQNYTYTSVPSGTGMNTSADTRATPASVARGFSGRVWLGAVASGDMTTLSIVCQGTVGQAPIISGDTCP
jgi:type II secretory pathway pseudopilin PulG